MTMLSTDKNDSDSSGERGVGEELEDASRKVENEIADCMKQQGFTYIPNPPSYAAQDAPLFRYSGFPCRSTADRTV